MEFRKKLIRKELYQSDILNIKTGYYKTENILPITPKPTEENSKKEEFILINDLLGQYYNKSFIDEEIYPLKRLNSEINILRKYAKIIRENCFDEKGNFSAKKRFKLEFYGIGEKNNFISKQNLNKQKNKNVKEKRKMNLTNNTKDLLKILDKDEGIKFNGFKRNNSCKIIGNIDNDYYKNNQKFEFNKKNLLNKKLVKEKSLTKKPLNIQSINKNSSTKNMKNKYKKQLESEEFDIEIKNDNKKTKADNILVDKTKLKKIFLINGLHIYNFNEEGTNILSNNQKFEAKLRKNINDKSFEKKYRKVIRELNKINIKVNRCGMAYENCIFNKNSKIRKGTPGKNLKKNLDKLNYGFKRDRYILPIQNKDYKNDYKYNSNNYNHNKSKFE